MGSLLWLWPCLLVGVTRCRVAACLVVMLPGMHARRYGGQNVRGLFDQWDESGDGLLSAEEFQAALRGVVKLTPREFQAVLSILDEDGNGVIDRKEFFAFVRTNKAARRDMRCVCAWYTVQ